VAAPGQPIVVNATVAENLGPVKNVRLVYRVGFGEPQTVQATAAADSARGRAAASQQLPGKKLQCGYVAVSLWFN
jgi:hypothetical protein